MRNLLSGTSNNAVLVTGATGFIGRHVVHRFLLAGRSVVVLARSCRGTAAQERITRIFGEWSERLEIVDGDLAVRPA